MKLTVLSSGSAGNGYVLEGRYSALLLECGVPPEAMMRRTSCPPSKVAGVLVSHEHGDHAAYAGRYAALGMRLYASRGTAEAIGRKASCVTAVAAMHPFRVGDFYVRPFDVRHDASEPLGFIIEHDECGRILFITDTNYCPYSFRDFAMDHIMVEANYDDRLLDGTVANGIVEPEQAERTRRSHLSLRDACELVEANQTAALKTVTLIHLSSRNADPKAFVRRMEETAIFARVDYARPGLSIELKRDDI